jgi:hypothetical protein
MKPSEIARKALGLEVDKFPRLASARYGDQADLDATWNLFEPVARTLVDTFYQTLDLRKLDQVEYMLDQVPAELRGIGYEGAAMGYALLDLIVPGRAELHRFLQGPGRRYQCLVYIGAGLVLARFPGNPMRFVDTHDPLLGWLILDGVGFHDGFFNWGEAIGRRHRARQFHGYELSVYDQGVGRSIWFSSGADAERIVGTINKFSVDRRADLWGGVGLACAYAAGVLDTDAISNLRLAAGSYAAQLGVGVGIASLFREQACGHAPHTALACSVLWGQSADAVAGVVHHAARKARSSAVVPDRDQYRRWREFLAQMWLIQDRDRRVLRAEQAVS